MGEYSIEQVPLGLPDERELTLQFSPRGQRNSILAGEARIGLAASSAQVGPVVEIPLTSILETPCPRREGLDQDHVRALAELDGNWPPVVVCRADNRLVDGHHRVAAARSLGRTSVLAQMFDGSPQALYLEFVRLNVTHGRPLSLADRRDAAVRMLQWFPDWSDRRIGRSCALSPHTVAGVRADQGEREAYADDFRTGEDGRKRRASPVAVREAIESSLDAEPGASLRTIARAVNASPETVRNVRKNRGGVGLVNAERVKHVDLAESRSDGSRPLPHWWESDSALNSTTEGRCLAQWLSDREVAEADCTEHLGAVPLSRVYEVAAEARRRSVAWSAFAVAVEAKAAPAGRASRAS